MKISERFGEVRSRTTDHSPRPCFEFFFAYLRVSSRLKYLNV